MTSTPAEQGSSSRFGNPAFRTLYQKIKENLNEFHQSLDGLKELKGNKKETVQADEEKNGEGETIGDGEDEIEISATAIQEIQIYFQESWGNEKRIDYGSGMELNFICWL